MDLQRLAGHGYAVYPRSIRPIEGGALFVASRDGRRFLGLAGTEVRLGSTVFGPVDAGEGMTAVLHDLTWENYQTLRTVLPVEPTPCCRPRSFGTGDRLGLVTAAHLDAFDGRPIFPVLAQQSPRELSKTGRSFRDVLLDAVMGVLEAGYREAWGADADHIKDERHLEEALRAGYTMYTLDLSGFVRSAPSDRSDASDLSDLSEHSRSLIRRLSGMRFGARAASEEKLIRSALEWQPAMERVERFHQLIRAEMPRFDLEISIDEGANETTLEDHLFVAEYLHSRRIDFFSLAPKFPGKFRKGIDYIGDAEDLAASMEMHAALARTIGGYRLSLHSGSDKWSVYAPFREAAQGMFHVKTSGTSWLEAVSVVQESAPDLFRVLYGIALDNLEESVQAYDTEIRRVDFPPELPLDSDAALADPRFRQLFHISYGGLLDECGERIRAVLAEHEERHYDRVTRHIERHLDRLLGG